MKENMIKNYATEDDSIDFETKLFLESVEAENSVKEAVDHGDSVAVLMAGARKQVEEQFQNLYANELMSALVCQLRTSKLCEDVYSNGAEAVINSIDNCYLDGYTKDGILSYLEYEDIIFNLEDKLHAMIKMAKEIIAED